jgi:hypothetical protein
MQLRAGEGYFGMGLMSKRYSLRMQDDRPVFPALPKDLR